MNILYLCTFLSVCSLIATTDTQASYKRLVPFSFEKKELVGVIEELAQRKEIVLFLPQGSDLERLKKQTVSFQPEGKTHLSLDEAWQLSQTFLALSGFSLIHKSDNVYSIVVNKPETVTRDVLPLYVGTDPEKLPQGDEPIRYIFYLRTVKVPTLAEKEGHSLTKMLKQLLSPTASILFEQSSNGVILTDKAPSIASAVTVLATLDAHPAGIEEVACIPLNYIPATEVVKIFDSLKKASGETQPDRPFVAASPRASSLTYFAQDTKILADMRKNAVLLMGKQGNIEKITDFIIKNLDQKQESGESILHYYDLKYLDAHSFAPVLQRAVSSMINGGKQQTTKVQEEPFFKGVQVRAEEFVEVKKTISQADEPIINRKGGQIATGLEGTARVGGNRLIIAARRDDWLIIKRLIDRLDTKKKQVLLEVLIADFTYDNQTIAAANLRSKTDNCHMWPKGVQFLASHISPVGSVLGTTPTQLAQDILQIVGPAEITRRLAPGSTLISLNDQQTPGIFGLLQLLQRVVKAKVQYYPYLVITDNQQGVIEGEEYRLVQGDLVTTTDGSYTIPIETVSAAIKVAATPRIVSDDVICLKIGFTADQFIGNTANRVTRELKTVATLLSGQIFAMGGVIREDSSGIGSKTPLFSQIPLGGVFFRGDNILDTVTTIVLLISPTILEPRKNISPTDIAKEKIIGISQDESSYLNDKEDLIDRHFSKDAENTIMEDFFRDSSNLNDFDPSHTPIKLMQSSHQEKEAKKTFNRDELKKMLAQQDTISFPKKKK